MSEPCAIFIGSAHDTHLCRAAERLNVSGHRVIIIDPFCPPPLHVELPDFILTHENTVVQPKFLWWRWKRALNRPEDGASNPVAISEWLGFAQNLRYLYADVGLHAPSDNLRANQKLVQLAVAKRFGFSIPETIVTNQKGSIVKRFETSEQIIKSIATPQLLHEDGFTPFDTQNLELRTVQAFDESAVAASPNFVQQKINKKREVRTTFVCGEISSILYTPKTAFHFDPAKRADWRVMYKFADLGFVDSEMIDLPETIECGVRLYCEAMGLNIACFDFAVDAEERYYFLEANPDGQWTWADRDGRLMDRFVQWVRRKFEDEGMPDEHRPSAFRTPEPSSS